MSRPVKTQTFKIGKVNIWQGKRDGWCDDPKRMDVLEMGIPDGCDFKTLWTIVHEAMHAEQIPDKYLDQERDASYYVALLIWRLDWRKQND